MVGDIAGALAAFSADPDIGCVVLTGSDRAFAAGADIKEAVDRVYPETFLEDFLASWDAIARMRKPLVAAVAGYALGGGCEVVLMCDVVIASDTAKFGLPEVKIGVMPGAGGAHEGEDHQLQGELCHGLAVVGVQGFEEVRQILTGQSAVVLLPAR
ncbi:enoyl-CoA hydratase-related protein [Xanthobacter sp. DSM 14520]|uniref:enoyl-CoA hydratase-related protein n=1 Tax=Xanthobacter autotrophicus (strain ATCC BAA-1158 / Py2) TaxID=78245 RepID=UPI00372A8342